MMIFAIVAVELFRDFGVDGEYTTVQTYGVGDARWGQGKDMSWSLDHPFVENTTVISAMTPRGYHYGQEYYGTFFRSLYTLFQVLTGESWSEAVVRPLLFGYTSNAVTVGVFFTVYILLMQVVLQNVVVAVLLDKFVEDPDEDKNKEGGEAEAATAEAGAVMRVEIDRPQGAAGGGSAGAPAARSKADEQVLAEADRLGVRAKDLSSGGARSGGSMQEEMSRLRGDVDAMLSEQALIRSHLHVILKRLDSLTPSTLAA